MTGSAAGTILIIGYLSGLIPAAEAPIGKRVYLECDIDAAWKEATCREFMPAPCPTPTPIPTPTPTPTPVPMPTPTPVPTPPPGPCAAPKFCPKMVRWGISLHTCRDARVGENCTLDTTERFGSGRGQPCNDEHNAICSCTGTDLPSDSLGWRRCEDPRGPDFHILEMPSGVTAMKDGFGLHLRRLQHGRYRIRACPPAGLQDAEGQPVEIAAGGGCGELVFDK